MDRLDEWRLFVAVAERRSFTAAARADRRSPQAVTRAIAALEARVGARLLHRTTRSVSLTDEGARRLESCRRALAAFAELEAGGAGEPRGVLTVTAPVLFGQLHVLPIVREFLGRFPAVDVRLSLLDRVVALAEEAVDLGVRIGGLPDSSLRSRLVGHVRWVVCASPAYLQRRGTPRDPRALARHACIAFTGTTPVPERWSFARRGGRERSVLVRSRLVVNTGQAAVDAALAGLGLARVLSYQVEDLVARQRLRIVLADHEPPPAPIHIVQLPGAQVRAASAFADLAVERLRARFSRQGADATTAPSRP
jgi:DNA-binding transcriptional LysR family regulator